MTRDAAEKFPNLFQILSTFAAHADAEEFDLDEIIRSSFAPSRHVAHLVQGGLREFDDLRRQRELAGQVISKFANRRFTNADDAIAWLSTLLQKLSPTTA
jgi:hypothetical protein